MKPNAKSKPRRSSLVLTVSAAILLVAGGAIAYWTLVQRRTPRASLPVGISVIPADALLTFSVSTAPSQWQQLRQFGTAATQTQFDQQIAQWRDRFLTANGYTYVENVQPWIGEEITVAFLSPPSNDSGGAPDPQLAPRLGQQSLLLVLPIADPEGARQVFREPGALSSGQRTYRGFQIWETVRESGSTHSAVVLDNQFLVVTNDPDVMEHTIDAYEDKTSLQTVPGYREAFGHIPTQQSFAKLFVNIPEAALAAAASSRRSFTPEDLSQLQQTQGLAATAALAPNGIRLRGTSWLKPDSERQHGMENRAGRLLGHLPANTLMMVSGGNLQRLWQDYTQGATANPVAPISPANLRQGLQSLTGLNLEQDLLVWMDGEFALAFIPLPEEVRSVFKAGAVFLVEVGDRQAAEETLEKLDAVMQDRYAFTVERSTQGNQSVTRWTSAEGGVQIAHGWLDDAIAFLALGQQVTQSLLPGPQSALPESQEFRQGVPAEPRPNNGHFFINLAELRNRRQHLPVPQFLINDRTLAPAIRTIGVTAAVESEHRTRYDILVQLEKTAEQPGPLPSPQLPSTDPQETPTDPN